jgi:hypothetical protein
MTTTRLRVFSAMGTLLFDYLLVNLRLAHEGRIEPGSFDLVSNISENCDLIPILCGSTRLSGMVPVGFAFYALSAVNLRALP